MKIFRLALVLSGLPFLSGCITYNAVQAARDPAPRILHNDYVHAEKAVISKDNQLLIFLKGSITNSPSDSLFTLDIPLAQTESRAGRYQRGVYHFAGTNEMGGAGLSVLRSSLHEGWPPEENSNDIENVPLGPPISPLYPYPNSFAGKLPETAGLLTNSTRTLYQVRQDGYLEFIYLDKSSGRAYTDIQVVSDRFTPKSDPGYYFLLPVTVPLDIATSPLQAVFVIMVICIYPGGRC